MRRIVIPGTLLGLATLLNAQVPTPQPPMPMLLPPSITGQPTPPTPVKPTGAAVPQQNPTSPMLRFTANLTAFPPETMQTVYSVRAGADWLYRMNQPTGRFFYGLNPAVRRALDGDHDVRQAQAAIALAESARFTLDERLTARATQSVLALLAQVKQEPITLNDKANRCGLMAGLVLAIYALPEADTRLLGEAETLCQQLRSRFDQGVLKVVDDGVKADAETAGLVPGMVVHALAVSNRMKPDAWKGELVRTCVGKYRQALKNQPNAQVAASLLPGLTELALMSNKDATLYAMAFELADLVCECQYGRGETPPAGWFGGFKLATTVNTEPTFESATQVCGLIAALKLTRQLPDVTRYAKYRAAVVEGLSFCRGLQFSEENTDHFEKNFRSRFLLGGVHLSPSDGIVRADATAQVVLAYLHFLNSGAEGRE